MERNKFLNIPLVSKGLIAYFPFNGTVNDESGNRSNGVNNNCTFVDDKNAKKKSALQLSGSSFVSFNNYKSLNVTGTQFSFAGWIYSNSVGYIFAKNYNSAFDVQFGFSFAATYINIVINQTFYNIPYTQKINTWNHYAFTVSNCCINLYVDAVLIDTINGSFSINDIPNSTFVIGKRNPSGGLFNGKFDEFYFYNRELSAKEIYLIKNQI